MTLEDGYYWARQFWPNSEWEIVKVENNRVNFFGNKTYHRFPPDQFEWRGLEKIAPLKETQ